MRRGILIGAGTVVGTAAVLAYQPGALFGTAVSTTPARTSSTTQNASESAGGQTYTGDAVQIRWGDVQVQTTVVDGKVTAVTATSYPDNDRVSSQLSASAIPALEQQAVEAGSADIDGVSGASYTSQAFAESLQSALTKAGL
ncbi:MAG: FMN-binding protein [Actinomycetes bacterium]